MTARPRRARCRRAPAWLAAALAAAACSTPATPPPTMAPSPVRPDDALEPGREYARLFYAGTPEALWARLATAFQAHLGGEARLAEFQRGVQRDLGAEAEVLSERRYPGVGHDLYVRASRFAGVDGAVRLQVGIDRDGRVALLEVVPAPPEPPEPLRDHEVRTAARLPFRGPWFVFWGGRRAVENHHAAAPDQRYAYDFVVVRDDATRRGDGTGNESYHCWDEPVLSPAAGVVSTAVDGVEDNPPGVMDARRPCGNHVVIDHGGEYSVLAHLRRGSVSVRPGERVEAGDPLGRCGSSGHSSEPHLHYHLQDGPDPGRGRGLPVRFVDYLADGVLVERGEPVRGQTVAPRPG